MSRRFDLIVLGAGPAGMAAAVRARALDLDVAVVDEQSAPGGQVWRNVERASAQGRATALGGDYADGAEAARVFRACGATYFPSTRVWQVEPGFRVYTRDEEGVDILSSNAVLVATGAIERAVPFRGWTMPGVLTVGAAQILLKSAGQIPDAPVWLAGNGPLLLLYANQLLDRGGRIAGILDTAPDGNRRAARPHLMQAIGCWDEMAKGMRWIARLRAAGVRTIRNVVDLEAIGEARVHEIRYRTAEGRQTTVPAGMLLVHEGVVPDVQVTLALGCRHDWNEAQQCFAPAVDARGETSMPGIFVAGDGSGIGGVRAARASGEIAALNIAQALGRLSASTAADLAQEPERVRTRALALRPFLDARYKPRRAVSMPSDDVVVCRCEAVTAGEIRAAASAGFGDPNQVKAATRCGMGPCLGRLCGLAASNLIADATGHTVAETGLYRVRPPLRPVTLKELAQLEGRELAA